MTTSLPFEVFVKRILACSRFWVVGDERKKESERDKQ